MSLADYILWIVAGISVIYTFYFSIKTYKSLKKETFKRIRYPKRRTIKRAYMNKDEFEKWKHSVLQKQLPQSIKKFKEVFSMRLCRKIYEIIKAILGLAVLIAQFYIMWHKGYYSLFFFFLILIPATPVLRDVMRNCIKKHILRKYSIKDKVKY